MHLQEYLKRFSSICWYPSAGFDFREMLYLSKEYATLTNWDEKYFPECFVLTDYLVMTQSGMITSILQGGTFLFQDENTEIVAINGKELERIRIPFYRNLVAFDKDENYGRVIVSDIIIKSSILGELNTKLIYVIAENTSFAFDFLIKNKISIDYVVHVRYGHMLGGGRSNGMFIKNILGQLGTRYFLSDMNYTVKTDKEALDVFGYILSNFDEAVMYDLFYIPSYRWSRSGDVHIYKVE